MACLASSKPPATFTWTKGPTVLANGTGTLTQNSFSYVIPRVVRADAGSYQCQAGNSVGSPDQKSVYLIVKYPPTVTVSISTSQPYKVTCRAEGNPDKYTYQDWVQVWPGYGPVATIPFTETTLTMTDITYEMSGVYVCSASNEVPLYGTDVEFVKGNATILIKAPPVLTDPSPGGPRVPVSGKLGQDATTEIKYWSNVDGTVVKCYKRVADSRSAFSSCSVTETDTEVTLPVHNHMVKETGTLAVIKIHISSKENMTAYDVVVSNSEKEESVIEIIVVPQDEYTVCSSMGSTVAMSVSATAFITLFLCTVVIVIVFRRFPDCIMRILQNTCLSGNIATDTEINKVQQSQLGMPVVYSTLVAAENSAGLEHLESTSTYESLNQFGSQPVYTSLKKAAEQRNTYENLKKQISPMHLDESDAKGSSQLI